MDFSSVISERILSSEPLEGGDIGRSYRVTTPESVYFVKWYSVKGKTALEAHGLSAMAECGAVTLPEIYGWDDHILVLKYLEQAPRCNGFQARLGRELAQMHKSSRAADFGFREDNYIGSIPQNNSWKSSWVDFFIENRIDPQVDRAAERSITECWQKLRLMVPQLLAGTEEEPCLIHGDLWAGNVISGPGGEPVLIDPAAYYGHREMELGMTRLFGGFTAEFYSAYNEEFALSAGWKDRANLYILYHVLNHYNMFGGGYRSQALGLMKNYL